LHLTRRRRLLDLDADVVIIRLDSEDQCLIGLQARMPRGFGLGLVEASADEWGFEPGPPARVWFEFRP
jgi:hypothetical protein